MAPREPTLTRLLRERGRHLADPDLFARARAEAHAAEAAMPDENPSPYWHARRAALKAHDAELDAARGHVPAGGPTDEAAIEAEAVEACRRHEEVVELVRSAPDVPPEPGLNHAS